jgi:uncharacterized protein DUF3857
MITEPRVRVPVLCAFALGMLAQSWAGDWPAISKEELAMADDPANPGAPAILLYREVTTNDVKGFGTEYRRIKILNDDGKKYADIEIPYVEGAAQIEGIQARTIRPDGTTVTFQGQIFDRTALRARKTKIQVKALTLPDVQNGSIIEYSYTARFRRKVPDVLKNPSKYLIDRPVVIPLETWLVQEDLFTRQARFTVRPFPGPNMTGQIKNVPGNKRPEEQPDGTTVLELENIPAFQAEELMPPENALRGRVDLFYQLGPPISIHYWEEVGTQRAEDLRSFLTDPKKLKEALSGIISANDSPEAQLRKIYSRVQQIRYVSYEPSKTEQQAKREDLKENRNVEDILKRNYAYANEINLVFVALARAAGFESAPMLVKSRDRGFFESTLRNPSQLDAMVVLVRAGDKNYFLDPATRYCPFDFLPWAEAGTTGIVIANADLPKSLNTGLVNTPSLTSAMAVIERKATLQLDGDGSVEGTIAVNYIGHEALERRIATANSDDTARKKLLEDEMKEWIPGATTVKLEGSVNWDQSEQPLHASFTVKVPSYAAPTGRRLLFRAGFFGGSAQSFKSDKRTWDVYFAHPFEETDDVTWKLPEGYRAGSLPEKQNEHTIFGTYTLSADASGSAIHSQRYFTVTPMLVPLTYYAALRGYFNMVRHYDESQIVLETGGEQNAAKPN